MLRGLWAFDGQIVDEELQALGENMHRRKGTDGKATLKNKE